MFGWLFWFLVGCIVTAMYYNGTWTNLLVDSLKTHFLLSS
jgi:hypothetical protein